MEDTPQTALHFIFVYVFRLDRRVASSHSPPNFAARRFISVVSDHAHPALVDGLNHLFAAMCTLTGGGHL